MEIALSKTINVDGLTGVLASINGNGRKDSELILFHKDQHQIIQVNLKTVRKLFERKMLLVKSKCIDCKSTVALDYYFTLPSKL